MLDYRYHYAVMAAEDRRRPLRRDVMSAERTRRVFRLPGRDSARASRR